MDVFLSIIITVKFFEQRPDGQGHGGRIKFCLHFSAYLKTQLAIVTRLGGQGPTATEAVEKICVDVKQPACLKIVTEVSRIGSVHRYR